ncbi:disease resistance protein RML1B-like protein [Tanacetum coccineum]
MGYEEFSIDIVKYSERHPLALEVLGRSLHNQDVAYWEDYLDRLKKEPDSHIQKVLKVSFHSLPDNDKELFKYIACFFVGKDRDFTEIVLKACGINTRSGITTLIQRCLVSITLNNKLKMHSLIQDMGRDLVRQESPNKPWMRSRLWDHEESFNVLKRRKGTEDILGLYLDMRMLKNQTLRGSLELQTDTLSNLDNLKLLQLNYVHINGSYENFPEELRWLCMHGFPFECIPSDLRMENLVALDISYSNIKSFDMPDSILQPPAKRQKRLIGSRSKDKRSLGSLKILDLSFCEQLRRLGGFSEFPSLEKLIVTNCIRLVEVCESIEQCAELSLINLSYCNNLEKLPTSLGKLKKVKTLLLDRCGLHERPAKMRGMDSQEMVRAINSQEFSCEAIPSKFKFLVTSFPSSLVRLSLENNNLSNESFPTDFSCLSMLKELNLNGNPIISMPTCVRSLPRLEELCMSYNKWMVSVEHPPRTLKALYIEEDGGKAHDSESSLRKILLDPEMSPLELKGHFESFKPWSVEIEGMFKAQNMFGAVNILHSLGWNNFDYTAVRLCRQLYYEFGIFSGLYEKEAMPNWIRHKKKGPIISFTIRNLSGKKLRGLNFCTLQTCQFYYFEVPSIKISNVTKNITWIYNHLIRTANISKKFVTFLSHWMFGANEMEAGDKVTITVTQRTQNDCQLTEECGFSFVYENDFYGRMKEEEEEEYIRQNKRFSWDYFSDVEVDRRMTEEEEYIRQNKRFEVDRRIKEKEEYIRQNKRFEVDIRMEHENTLSYYKSWNNIIGKDLSAFQSPAGEYILQNKRSCWDCISYSNRVVYSVPDEENSIG